MLRESLNELKIWIVYVNFLLLWNLGRMSQLPKYYKSTKFFTLDVLDSDFLLLRRDTFGPFLESICYLMAKLLI
jgi:hypothetical protein